MKQLAPISVSETTDVVRLKHNQMDDAAMDWLKGRGFSCSEGNVMRAAQELTRFTDQYPQPGIMLRDHYRCLPEIIRYCDELAYGGLLRPVRGSIENAAFPAMGYAHMRGRAERVGRSWRNGFEARTIAEWLHHNRDAIMQWANQADVQNTTGKQRPLEQIVAVVAPYRAQVLCLTNEIKTKLSLKEPQMRGFTINTVHALQGAERDMVIFSPTVRAQGDTRPLHERDERMLNVAVSRAKNSFLVFGDMELFTERSSARASGLLAKHLYRRPENQVIADRGYSLDCR